ERRNTDFAERVTLHRYLAPKDRIVGHFRVERIDRADVRNVPIALWFFGLPSDHVPVAHAVPLDEAAVGFLDLDADGRAVAAIDMPAQFVISEWWAFFAPRNQFRVAVRVKSRADGQDAILN